MHEVIEYLESLNQINNTMDRNSRRFPTSRSRDMFTQDGNFGPQLREFANLLIFLVLIVVLGFPIATLVFITVFIATRSPRHTLLGLGLAVGLVSIMWTLASMLTLQYPAGWISGVIDMPWWLSGY